jgi:hypothetical protein
VCRLEESIPRGRKRTSADFTFCCIAIGLYRHRPEATDEKVMELSTKAQENGHDYALEQAQRAAVDIKKVIWSLLIITFSG